MTESAAVATIRATGILAVLRAPSPEAALGAIDALVAGGVTGIEVTYSTPDATAVIAETARRHGDAVLLGAGTVTTPEQAEHAADAGAVFLVSPGTTPLVAGAMRATGAATLLGALTPTEVMSAVSLGADAVKIFPAALGGPAYLKALRGPFPDVPMMPTGGVDADNLGTWLSAGAIAVGAGSELCSAAAMAGGRFEEIEASARQFVAELERARAGT